MSENRLESRAIVFEGAGTPLNLQDVLVSGPTAGEVLVRVAACGACHSDVHKMEGRGNVEPPCIFGHEISGTVVSVGNAVQDVAPGTPILCGFVVPCGECPPCVEGMDEECIRFRNEMQHDGVRFDGSHRYFRPDGAHLRASGVGGLSELVALPSTAVTPIPTELVQRHGLGDIAVLGCAGLTAYSAVHVAGQVTAGDVVVVLAAGGVGLCSTAIAKAAGAETVVTTDVRDEPLAFAADFGADRTVNIESHDLAEVISQLSAGRGADVVIDTIGTATTVASAMAIVRTGGRVAVSGLAGTDPAAVDLERLVRRKISLVGSYGTHTREHLPAVLELVSRGALDPSRLVTQRYPLAAAADAYSAVATGTVVGRALIEFD